MNASHLRRAGFTLIELLTVIAIIGVLTALTAVVLPRIMEKARLTETQNVANQLRILLTAYYTEHGTYPPAYGYIKPDEFGTPGIQIVQIAGAGTPNDFVTIPWMAALGEHGNLDLYDPFSTAVDININRTIEMIEYSPIGGHNPADYVGIEFELDSQKFLTRVYNGVADALLDDDVNLQLAAEKRPFIYIPINKRQFRRVRDNWFEEADISGNDDGDETNDNPRPNDALSVNTDLAAMNFPPPSYDAYVLISLGPYGNYPSARPLYGLLYDSSAAGLPFLNLADPAYPAELNGEATAVKQLYRYHYMAMATYFMATRDADDNGKLDFDFLKRSIEDEGANPFHRFEDPNVPNIAGPLIFLSP